MAAATVTKEVVVATVRSTGSVSLAPPSISSLVPMVSRNGSGTFFKPSLGQDSWFITFYNL